MKLLVGPDGKPLPRSAESPIPQPPPSVVDPPESTFDVALGLMLFGALGATILLVMKFLWVLFS